MAYYATLGFDFPFLSTFLIGASDFLSNWPLDFLTSSLGAYDSLGNGPMISDDMISVLDLLHPVNSRISSSF